MIKTINGIPGSGKNVLATHDAIKHFKNENNLLHRVIRRILHKPRIINNVYTTYPICLKKYPFWSKKQPIYSNRITIFDLTPSNRFLENSLIIIDETQVLFDSEEYKEFPRDIATFNQFHRHFDIKDIYYITQHPSRLMKKLRILCCEYDKVKTFINIPLFPIALMHIVKYFEFDDYGKYHHPKKEAKTYDVKNQYMFFLKGRVFRSYKSKYMKILNIESPLYNKGTFSGPLLTDSEIKFIFRDKI